MKQSHSLRTLLNYSVTQPKTLKRLFEGVFEQYVYLKIKKIGQALYIVTSHISNDEPIKISIREAANRLVLLSVKIKPVLYQGGNTVAHEEICDLLMTVITYLEMASLSELINVNNHLIISREADNLLNELLVLVKDKETDNKAITPSFFGVDIKDSHIKDSHIKDKSEKGAFIKDNLSPQTGTVIHEKSVPSNVIGRLLRTEERAKREQTIMSFFGNGQKLTVSDVHNMAPTYGEKTLQRELSRLVTNNLLAKEGRKRWTRYFKPL